MQMRGYRFRPDDAAGLLNRRCVPPWFPPPRSPPLDRKDKDRPSHQEGREAHCDSEGEHGIEIIMLHSADSIFVAGHEDKTT